MSVYADALAAYWSRYTHVSELPAEARAFIAAFDAGETVAPFEFDLPAARLEDREGRPTRRMNEARP